MGAMLALYVLNPLMVSLLVCVLTIRKAVRCICFLRFV